jgi:uncharacterized membrane protein
MFTVLAGFLAGAATGLRSLTAPAAVSWAASTRRLQLKDTPLAFLGHRATPYVLTALAVAELVNDKLPWTPSRKAPPAFAARLAMGALCGAALSAPGERTRGAGAGVLGAVAGTLGGYEYRMRLAKAAGSDLPAALSEDALAVGGAAAIVTRLV